MVKGTHRRYPAHWWGLLVLRCCCVSHGEQSTHQCQIGFYYSLTLKITHEYTYPHMHGQQDLDDLITFQRSHLVPLLFLSCMCVYMFTCVWKCVTSGIPINHFPLYMSIQGFSHESRSLIQLVQLATLFQGSPVCWRCKLQSSCLQSRHSVNLFISLGPDLISILHLQYEFWWQQSNQNRSFCSSRLHGLDNPACTCTFTGPRQIPFGKF